MVTDDLEFKTSFEIRPYQKSQLLQGLDEVGDTLIYQAKISSFEKAYKIYYFHKILSCQGGRNIWKR